MNPLENQFTTGGLFLMMVGSVIGLLRNLPGTIYQWLKIRLTVSITFIELDPMYEWVKIWMDSLPYAKKSRSITASLHRKSEEEFSIDSQVLFSPAYGSHFFRHNGRLVWLDRTKAEKNSAPAVGKSGTVAPESITLTVLGTDQKILRRMVGEIKEVARKLEQQEVKAYTSGHGWWRNLPTFAPRHLNTVDIPESMRAQVLDGINAFLSGRQVYAKRGVPYHLNFLFAGPPGTGKTSLASALAGYFRMNLYLLNIAGPHIDDESLIDLMLSLPRRSIVLMEDVDAVVPDREAKPKATKDDEESGGVTLSGLLNCMDGITAPDGVVIIMTTNHPDKLDPALLRPGRVDLRVEFEPANPEQIRSMASRFGCEIDDDKVFEFLDAKLTTAQVQSELIQSL